MDGQLSSASLDIAAKKKTAGLCGEEAERWTLRRRKTLDFAAKEEGEEEAQRDMVLAAMAALCRGRF